MADLGDLIPLGIQVRDENQTLVDADDVVLTIVQPDGVTATPLVVNDDTGMYSATFTPTIYGRHLIRWLVTGPEGAFTDTFDVRDLSVRSIISLADAKVHMNMKSSLDDEEIRQMLEAVTYAIERHRNETIPLTTYVEPLHNYSTGVIQLDHRPVNRIVSITSGLTTYNNADWSLDEERGVLYGRGLSKGAVITYQAGYRVIPAHYILAAKITLAHIWQTQRLPSVGPQTGFGVRQGTVGNEPILTASGLGNALPPRAIELLGPRPSMIV